MPDDIIVPTLVGGVAKRKLVGINIRIDPSTGEKSARFQFEHFYAYSDNTYETRPGATVQADNAQLDPVLIPAVIQPIRALAKALADAEEAK